MVIGPDKWGVHGWKFIHHIALGYPNNPTENDKNNYKSFFLLLGNVLPCHICSDHYNEHLLIYPLNDTVLSNKINFINWTIDMHNAVNKKNGTKIYDYDEALELIRNNYQTFEDNKLNNDKLNNDKLNNDKLNNDKLNNDNTLLNNDNTLLNNYNTLLNNDNTLLNNYNTLLNNDNTLLIIIFIILLAIVIFYKKYNT